MSRLVAPGLPFLDFAMQLDELAELGIVPQAIHEFTDEYSQQFAGATLATGSISAFIAAESYGAYAAGATGPAMPLAYTFLASYGISSGSYEIWGHRLLDVFDAFSEITDHMGGHIRN